MSEASKVSQILKSKEGVPEASDADRTSTTSRSQPQQPTNTAASQPPPKEEQKPASKSSRATVTKVSQKSSRSTDASYTEVPDIIELKTKSNETLPPIDREQFVPDLHDKFTAYPWEDIIRYVMNINLEGKTFDAEMVQEWCTVIADQVNEEVKKIGLKRYKHVVQVVVGERSGAGLNVGCKCLWDKEADGFTSDSFINETLFCTVAVFGVYCY